MRNKMGSKRRHLEPYLGIINALGISIEGFCIVLQLYQTSLLGLSSLAVHSMS